MIATTQRVSSHIILSSQEKNKADALQRELSAMRNSMRYHGYPLWKHYEKGLMWALKPGKDIALSMFHFRLRRNKKFRDKKLSQYKQYRKARDKDPVRAAANRKYQREWWKKRYHSDPVFHAKILLRSKMSKQNSRTN